MTTAEHESKFTAQTLLDFLKALKKGGHNLSNMQVVVNLCNDCDNPDAIGYAVTSFTTSDGFFGMYCGMDLLLDQFALDVMHDTTLQEELLQNYSPVR